MSHPVYNRFNSLKILHYGESHLEPIARGELPFPIDWHIYPSNVCNHKCTWCMFRQNGEQFNFRVKLPRELLLRAVKDAARAGARLIHFSGGGEPLLNKHTPEAMELAKSLGVSVAMSTNGRLLTPEIAGLVDYIRVSLNAGTKEQHWRTNHGSDERDPGDWETILENIRAAVPCKRQDFGLGFVVDHENWNDIYPFCAVAAAVGVDFVHIRPGFYYEPEKDALVRQAMPHAVVECDRAKRDFGHIVDIYSITEKFEGYWSPKSYSQCHAVKTGICLRATGDFAVCQDRTDLTFGTKPNYALGAAFEDVWGSEEHRAVMDRICAGDELDKCPRCVWNKRNEIIQDVYIDDKMRMDLP